jgi:processive 1,2-diacylglycerol beta-glucosyltransferase
MAGSFGMGPLKEIALKLIDKNQVLVGCGKNKKLLSELQELAADKPNLKPIGFVDYTDELMAVSDLIITKPGGLTISESLAVGLPLIFISAIKGQETRNADLMQKIGVGFNPKDLEELTDIVSRLREDPQMRVLIKDKISKIARPTSARQIANHVLNLHA